MDAGSDGGGSKGSTGLFPLPPKISRDFSRSCAVIPRKQRTRAPSGRRSLESAVGDHQQEESASTSRAVASSRPSYLFGVATRGSRQAAEQEADVSASDTIVTASGQHTRASWFLSRGLPIMPRASRPPGALGQGWRCRVIMASGCPAPTPSSRPQEESTRRTLQRVGRFVSPSELRDGV